MTNITVTTVAYCEVRDPSFRGKALFNPEPDTPIRAGDKLVVLGRPESLKQLESEAAG